MAGKLTYRPSKRTHRNGRIEWRIVVGYKKNSKGNYTPQYLPCRNETHAKSESKRLLAEQATSDDLGIEAIKHANKHAVASCVAKLAAVGATIEEATEYYLTNKFAKQGNVTSKEALNDFLKDSIKGNIAETSLETYKTRVDKISDFLGDKLINSVTTEDLEKMFEVIGEHWSNNTMNPWKRFTQTIWNWFGKHGYVAQKTEHAASLLKIPKRDTSTPKMSNVDEVHHLLYWFDTFAGSVGGYKKANTYDCIVYLLLCLYLGIRKQESYFITWDDVDFNNRRVAVLVEGSKTDRRRVNDLPDNVWNWFVYLKDKATLDSKGDPRRRLSSRLRKYRESFSKRGKPVPDIVATVMKPAYGGKLEPKEKYHNIMRHTMCGYHYKCYESAGLTGRIMGTSEARVRGDYYELVKSKEEAELYFKINPPVIPSDSDFEVLAKVDREDQATLEKLRSRAVESYIQQELLNPFLKQHADLYNHHKKVIEEYTQKNLNRLHDVMSDAEWRSDPDVEWRGDSENPDAPIEPLLRVTEPKK